MCWYDGELPRLQRRLTIFFALLGTILVVAPAAGQQDAVLVGRVNGNDGAPVADAAVILRPAGAAAAVRTVLTDRSGNFRMPALQAGPYRLRTQRLGFVADERDVQLVAGETHVVEIVLRGDTLVLEGIVAEVRRDTDRERTRFETEAGVTARVVEAQVLKTLPGLGEADILRAIELLPGVISTSDFSSSYNVRGGSADQNLILVDGFTVFNPFHLGGLFSVFNSDAVEQAELFAGGFGAEFGGRVSSVLNIESRSELADSVEFYGGVSVLASRLLVRAPMPSFLGTALGGDRGTWFASARRSYFDQLLRPVVDFPYHLTDLQAFASVETRGGGRLNLTGYSGADVLDLSGFGLTDEGAAADVLRLRWNWGNRVIGARWQQPLRGGWISETRVGYSRFADQLRFVDFGDVRFGSRISQAMLRTDLGRDFSPSFSVRTGISAERLAHDNVAEAGGTTFFESTGNGILSAAYTSVRWRPTAQWIFEPGLRLDVWSAIDTTRVVPSPRFAAKRFFGPGDAVAVKLAVGRYTQFLHSLRDEELPVSNDTWVLANRDVPHVVSDQAQLGLESFWGAGWSGSLEAYFRNFAGVTDLNTFDDPNEEQDDLLVGTGRSYGLDFMLRRSEGRLTGWTALSLLRARRTFPDPLAAAWQDLPQEVTYAPIFDRNINLDLVAQYTTARDFEFGARWNFGSGLPYTRPVAQYLSWRQNPFGEGAEPSRGGQERGGVPVNVVLGPRNSERYPAYHRLDLTVRKTYRRRWGTFVPYLQVLNAYNRRNVLFYFYDYNRAPPVRSGFSMFPILPAIGMEFTF
jgi:hypothetical protein